MCVTWRLDCGVFCYDSAINSEPLIWALISINAGEQCNKEMAWNISWVLFLLKWSGHCSPFLLCRGWPLLETPVCDTQLKIRAKDFSTQWMTTSSSRRTIDRGTGFSSKRHCAVYNLLAFWPTSPCEAQARTFQDPPPFGWKPKARRRNRPTSGGTYNLWLP